MLLRAITTYPLLFASLGVSATTAGSVLVADQAISGGTLVPIAVAFAVAVPVCTIMFWVGGQLKGIRDNQEETRKHFARTEAHIGAIDEVIVRLKCRPRLIPKTKETNTESKEPCEQ